MLPTPVVELFRRSRSGLASTAEIRSAGFGAWHLSRWVADGLVERVLPTQHRLAGAPVPPTQCLHLPVRYLARPGPGPWAVISGEGVLAALEVGRHRLPCVPTVLIERGRRVRLTDPPFTVVQTRLGDVPHQHRNGVPMATVQRAIADLALGERVTDSELIEVVDDARNRLRLATVDLVTAWRELRGHPGARRLLDLAAAEVFEQESPGERLAFTEIFRAHPPEPDCQVWVTDRFRVDFIFVFAALIVEYEGRVHDGRADEDATRRMALERLGYRVIVITRSMLRDPTAVAEFVHRVRREREDAMLRGALLRPPFPAQPERLTPLRTVLPCG